MERTGHYVSEFLAGFAEVDYTPELGLKLRGQQYVRVAERVRDPLLANAVAMRSGDETVVIVSVDICFVTTEFVTGTQEAFAERTGLPAERLLIHTTHSHVAPAAVDYRWATADLDFLDKLRNDILSAAMSAIDRLEPVTVFSGAGKLDCLNWNRRSMYANGTSAMHGSADREGFIGTEGTRDANLSVLFFRNSEGAITGVITNFGTHPNCVENGFFYSADLPGEVRRLLKALLGADTGVVYLTGAAGNVSPIIHEPGVTEQPWMGEDGLGRAGLYMTGEIGKVIAQAVEPIESPALTVRHAALRVAMRPFPAKGERCYPDFWTDESREYYEALEADWPRKMREESPVEVRVNVIRIGDTAICTNPAEIFSDYALAMREVSPARVTLISQLTDGHIGYLPTPEAFTRGGYETWPAGTSKLVPEAGQAIVDATRDLLGQVF
jgi:neutral ceramidase